MSIVNLQHKNEVVVMGGIVLTAQAACPITAGQVGLWLDSVSGLVKVRLADGTDTVQGNEKLYAFVGHNGAGAITLTGAAVGDVVLGLIDVAAGTISAASSFEATISVVNQIQQSSVSDLSAKKYAVLLASAA